MKFLGREGRGERNAAGVKGEGFVFVAEESEKGERTGLMDTGHVVAEPDI